MSCILESDVELETVGFDEYLSKYGDLVNMLYYRVKKNGIYLNPFEDRPVSLTHIEVGYITYWYFKYESDLLILKYKTLLITFK